MIDATVIFYAQDFLKAVEEESAGKETWLAAKAETDIARIAYNADHQRTKEAYVKLHDEVTKIANAKESE